MYDNSLNKRESAKYYIPATDSDLQLMLKAVNCKSLQDLFSHISGDAKFDEDVNIPKSKTANQVIEELQSIAIKNNTNSTSFLSNNYKVQSVVPEIASIRGLTTSYTPYQPERSQGTLLSHWIYQCVLAQITGFEAINASMYDRATTLFEAIKCAVKIQKKKKTIIITGGVKANDKEVLKTHARFTSLNLIFEDDASFLEQGVSNVDSLSKLIDDNSSDLAAVVYPQSNYFGNLEPVDTITNKIHSVGALAITIINPILLGTNGLKPPVDFGNNGADIFVAEGQHLAIASNFGGPGLGIFGIRFNLNTEKHIRSTAGRFVGDAKDVYGKQCKVIILSTREQHIRREKANSNICSNEAFVATLAGASLLQLGEKGLQSISEKGSELAQLAIQKLTAFDGVELAFTNQVNFSEVTFKSSKKIDFNSCNLLVECIENHNVDGFFFKLNFTNKVVAADLEKIVELLAKTFTKSSNKVEQKPVSTSYLRNGKLGLLTVSENELVEYYKKLGDLNMTPDNTIYPLGSCTMKYNPYLNDYVANLDGFTASHPNDSLDNNQGSLEVLYQIQEYFKQITGLPAVTTQPVAGAQGELVGVKMFQAYHKNNGETRDIILIPKSAHGTNPATATYAGFDERKGIVLIDALPTGKIDFDKLKEVVAEYNTRICGIMVTNPNTSGLFETRFKEIADLIHSVGGLVYMDGANMNAIAGWVNLNKLGVDAVHNNLHKTWSIPHGGGGPGDGIVAVSNKLVDYLPGIQVVKFDGTFKVEKPTKSIGSFHRNYGNFAHKVRCLTYLKALGSDGIKQMSAVAVLSARYLFVKLNKHFSTLPNNYDDPIMHEFIITFSESDFDELEKTTGLSKIKTISQFGKLFLDYGYHAPTVAFPEVLGLMIEPTESYTKQELDDFSNAVIQMKKDVFADSNILLNAPSKAPIAKVDEVDANRNIKLSELLTELPQLP